MPKHDFKFLELEEQIKLIEKGKFIKSIDLENRTLSLYLLEDEYYVEVFSEEDSKQIDFINLASEERLPLYIDLDSLLN